MTEHMPWIDINLVIMMGISLVAFITFGIFVLVGMKIIKSGRTRQTKGQMPLDDEARLIQEIYQGLTRMEQRVESLEVLLFDQKKERES